MKRYILFPVILLFFSAGAMAQTGSGARGIFGVDGNAYGGLEFSIQHPGHYELDLGFSDESWKVTALKHYSFVK